MRRKEEESISCRNVEIGDAEVVRSYVEDLKGLWERSTIVEQKSFLKSFVGRIEVGDSEVKVVYNIPTLPHTSFMERVGILYRMAHHDDSFYHNLKSGPHAE